METSSISGASGIFSNGTSTVAGKKQPKSKGKIFEKLRTRRAFPDKRSPEDKTDRFKSDFGIQAPIAIPFEETKKLQEIIDEFLQTAKTAEPTENSYDALENLSHEINCWRSTVQLTTVTNKDFTRDIRHCKGSNEAVFQRTAMLSIIDRWRLNDTFDYNCEGQWSLQGKDFPLPSTEGPEDKISGPKPDLTIFFDFDTLIETDYESRSAPIPPDLKACIRPDESEHRCFPFLFIEAKRGYHDLTPAIYANMHSASQALLNIYVWMARAELENDFFNDVRLFSIALNAGKALVRVHRAKALGEERGLVYLFDELCEVKTTERDQICGLIRKILLQYGATTLQGLLKTAFKTVSEKYQKDILAKYKLQKRKHKGDHGGTGKRPNI